MPTPRNKARAEEIDRLMRYIEQGGSLGLEIQKMLEPLPEKYSVLFVTRRAKYDLLIANIVSIFCKKGMPGLFVTINKSGKDLVELLQKNEAECSNMLIIDAVSRGRTGSKDETGRITYIDSPQNLTEIEAQIMETAEGIKSKEKFFVLDSLSTLLIYNNERTIQKFFHSLAEKMRLAGFKAIFTITDGTKPEVINVLSQFCDKVLSQNPKIRT